MILCHGNYKSLSPHLHPELFKVPKQHSDPEMDVSRGLGPQSLPVLVAVDQRLTAQLWTTSEEERWEEERGGGGGLSVVLVRILSRTAYSESISVVERVILYQKMAWLALFR